MSGSEYSGDGVYILEFSEPVGNERHSARYYVGWTRNIEGRLHYHRRGAGAAITRAAVARGITFTVALFIPGAKRELEREIKRRKNTRRWLESYLRRMNA